MVPISAFFSSILFFFLWFSDSFFFLSQILLLRSLHPLIFMVTLYSCFSIILGMIEKATKFYEGFQSTKQKQLEDRDRLLQVIRIQYDSVVSYLVEWGEIIGPEIKQWFSLQKKSFSKKTNSYPVEEISDSDYPQVCIS